jgi:hypothetical protein
MQLGLHVFGIVRNGSARPRKAATARFRHFIASSRTYSCQLRLRVPPNHFDIEPISIRRHRSLSEE